MSQEQPKSQENFPELVMTSSDVLDFYNTLKSKGIRIWIDGGWGVDALLGEQTRPHGDLDIAIEEEHVDKARELLEAQGYKNVPRDDTSPWNFVLGDAAGHQIDFHVIVFDEEGRGILGPTEKNSFYPAGSLTGTGTINGQTVECISPEHMVQFHTGYKPRPSDFHDVVSLCDRYGIEYPSEYAHLKKSGGDESGGAG